MESGSAELEAELKDTKAKSLELNAFIGEVTYEKFVSDKALKEAKEANVSMNKDLDDSTIEVEAQSSRIRELESGTSKLEADLKDTKAKSDQTETELNAEIKELHDAKIVAERALKEAEEAE